MKRSLTLVIVVLILSFAAYSQRVKPADGAELADISQRGKLLAEYDVAAWHSTDAVIALSPKKDSFDGFIAKKTGSLWTVAYGRLSEQKDKYLIAYEATQQTSSKDFKVQAFEKPKEDIGFFLNAARALATAKAGFTPAEQRPYNAAVLPASDGQFFVYLVPAQTVVGVFPLGGDTRFRVAKDGSKITETRQLHKSIVEFQVPENVKPETGYHTAILDDVPEDTDVFHVLAREPRIPELVVTQRFVYQIQVDGSIQYLMTTEAFKKVGKK